VIARFNRTGTHLYKGSLKVRIDLYPEPADKTYAQHNVSKPVIPPGGYPGVKDIFGGPLDPVAYKAWEDALPHVNELNPCLCHFLRVAPSITLPQLIAQIRAAFDQMTVSNLDTLLSELKPGYLGKLSALMRTRLGNGGPGVSADIEKLNSRFSKLELTLGNY
jgi:hypothetical protein